MTFNFKIQTPWLKGAGKLPPEKTANSFDWYRMRAFQYVCARYAIRKTTYRENCRNVHFFEAKVGVERRIQAVMIDETSYLIPHWDFQPEALAI